MEYNEFCSSATTWLALAAAEQVSGFIISKRYVNFRSRKVQCAMLSYRFALSL